MTGHYGFVTIMINLGSDVRLCRFYVATHPISGIGRGFLGYVY